MGFRAAQEEASADAILEGAWLFAPPGPSASSPRISLRLELRSREGRSCFLTEAIPGTPLGFLSPERVRDEVEARLASLPEALRRLNPGTPCGP